MAQLNSRLSTFSANTKPLRQEKRGKIRNCLLQKCGKIGTKQKLSFSQIAFSSWMDINFNNVVCHFKLIQPHAHNSTQFQTIPQSAFKIRKNIYTKWKTHKRWDGKIWNRKTKIKATCSMFNAHNKVLFLFLQRFSTYSVSLSLFASLSRFDFLSKINIFFVPFSIFILSKCIWWLKLRCASVLFLFLPLFFIHNNRKSYEKHDKYFKHLLNHIIEWHWVNARCLWIPLWLILHNSSDQPIVYNYCTYTEY